MTISKVVLFLFFLVLGIESSFADQSKTTLTLQKYGSAEALITLDPELTSELTRCLQNGLAVRARYTTQLCRRRPIWFGRCGDKVVRYHHLKREPLSGEYRLTTDRLDDLDQPQTSTIDSESEARRELAQFTINLYDLENGSNRHDWWQTERAELTVRQTLTCRGEGRGMFGWLTYALTLGQLDLAETDRGEIHFRVADALRQSAIGRDFLTGTRAR
jgi:hypothetical protein